MADGVSIETYLKVKAKLSTAEKRLAEASELINKVVEINIHRDDEGDFFCHECKSWNHATGDSSCTTAMLQSFLKTALEKQ
jgi:hypothetical protein